MQALASLEHALHNKAVSHAHTHTHTHMQALASLEHALHNKADVVELEARCRQCEDAAAHALELLRSELLVRGGIRVVRCYLWSCCEGLLLGGCC
eukprot:313930-Pelagomonas_calceolata.AAC.9